ncbi:hypothetical protein NFI96_007633, partial [Prochilodus magdalenae]
MCPVIVRGQNLEYKPWLNTDMSDILEKLPTLQEGAHPWISKLEELMVGTQPAVGDIKRLLANLLGVPAMGEILQKAGLGRYVGTAVNDAELFAATRGVANTSDYENPLGPYPAKSFYGYDTMNDKDRKQFDEWYNTVSGGVFDFKKELYVYDASNNAEVEKAFT